MKRTILVLAAVATAMTMIFSCGGNGGRRKVTEDNDTTKTASIMNDKTIQEPEFDIITSLGTMRVKLYSKTPLHRENFKKLVGEKYYDSLRFHRVIEGFMIQTGDPYSRDTANIDLWGQGGPGYTVPAEFVNEYWHKKGALAAARRGDVANPKKASSGSQFYIVHDENACLHLDGQYTIFGEVIEGLDVVDKIATVAVDRYNRPYEDVFIERISPVITEQADTTAVTDSTITAPADSTVATADSTDKK